MVPTSWSMAREDLDPDTPFNFVATTDITGGNSGSPMIAADGTLIGLAFDGNIHLSVRITSCIILSFTEAIIPDLLLRYLAF